MATTANFLKLASLIDTGGLLRESRGILGRYWTHSQNEKSKDPIASPSSENKLSALKALVCQSNAESKSHPEKLKPKTPGFTYFLH